MASLSIPNYREDWTCQAFVSTVFNDRADHAYREGLIFDGCGLRTETQNGITRGADNLVWEVLFTAS